MKTALLLTFLTGLTLRAQDSFWTKAFPLGVGQAKQTLVQRFSSAAQSYDTLALALAANPANFSQKNIQIGGRLVNGDGFQGSFRYSPGNTLATNLGTSFAVPYGASTGRLIRNYTGVVELSWFGAIPGGTIDDELVSAFTAGCKIHIKEGTYYSSSEFSIPTQSEVYGDGPERTILQNCGATNLTMFKTTNSTTFTGIRFVGNCGIGATDTCFDAGGPESKFFNCHINGFATMVLVRSGYSEIQGCRFSTVRADGYAVVLGSPPGASGNRINNNRFELGPGSGILVAFPSNGDSISGNIFENGSGAGITIPPGTTQFTLTLMGNYWEGVVNPLLVGVGSGTKPAGSLNLIGNEFAGSYAPFIGNVSNLVTIGNRFGTGWGVGAVDNLVNLQNVAPSFVNNATHYVTMEGGALALSGGITGGGAVNIGLFPLTAGSISSSSGAFLAQGSAATDAIRLIGQTAGTGATIEALNVARTGYAPLKVLGSRFAYDSGSGSLFEITSVGLVIIDQLPPIFANNAAASGLAVGTLYRTGANPDVLCIVH